MSKKNVKKAVIKGGILSKPSGQLSNLVVTKSGVVYVKK